VAIPASYTNLLASCDRHHIAGALELAVILGPVWVCTTWVWHNLVALLLWLPTLAIAAWQLSTGWQPAGIVFVALGGLFIVAHMVLLLAYWVRATLRKQAAMELPTQQLLVRCACRALAL
jgi:hypothetical protein